HQGRETGGGAGHGWEQRGVDDPQPGDAAYPALVVGDRHRVAVGAHAAGAGGVPHADPGRADEGFERLVVGHQLVEAVPLDDVMVDQIAPQPLRSVDQLGDDLRLAPVLVVDHAD